IRGLVDTMATHLCTNCGHEEHIFGHGGVAAEAKALGVPLLAELPLEMGVRTGSDSGVPVVVAAPESNAGKAFLNLARGLVSAGIA
ncbi:MAG: P-loop NTPase, partial [Jhaorihella sp.]